MLIIRNSKYHRFHDARRSVHLHQSTNTNYQEKISIAKPNSLIVYFSAIVVGKICYTQQLKQRKSPVPQM